MNMKTNLVVVGLAVAVLSAAEPPALEIERLPESVQRQLDVSALRDAFGKAANNDPTATAALRELVNKAHSQGVPLALLVYRVGQGNDDLRRLSAETLYASFVNGGIGWEYVPLITDTFLLARDPPSTLFFDGARPMSVASRLQGYENTIRDVCLESMRQLMFPPDARPDRAQYDNRKFGPSVMAESIARALQQPNAALDKHQRDILTSAQTAITSFIAAPPPFAVLKWREASEREHALMQQPPTTPERPSSASQQQPAAVVRPVPPPTATEPKVKEPLPNTLQLDSTTWSMIVVSVMAALGLLWLVLKKRK